VPGRPILADTEPSPAQGWRPGQLSARWLTSDQAAIAAARIRQQSRHEPVVTRAGVAALAEPEPQGAAVPPGDWCAEVGEAGVEGVRCSLLMMTRRRGNAPPLPDPARSVGSGQVRGCPVWWLLDAGVPAFAARKFMIFCMVVLAPAARFRAGPSAGK
jgi:hypothetical protein